MIALVELARAHAALLVVLAPLTGAAAALVIPHARASWAVALLAALAAAVIASDAGARHLFAGEPAADGVLRFSGVGAFAAPVLTGAAAVVLFSAGLSDLDRRVAPFAMALALAATAGWAGALLAQDWLSFVAAVEGAWLSAVGLAALGERSRGALNGALRMLTAGGAAAALMLLGVALIARAGGSVMFAALPDVAGVNAATVGIVLVLLGLALKAGVAPLHVWAAAVYGRAGPFAGVFLGAVCMTGAVAALVRVGALAAAAPAIGDGVAAALAALGAASIVIGAVQAIGATSVRRMAGYAIASQIGCILLSVSLGSPAGFAAALVQLFALSAAALALFAGAAVVGDARLSALDGVGRRYPLAGVALTAGALSLVCAPLTIGFLGRWRLIEAAVGAGWWWAAGTALVASLAAVFYGGRLIERVYFRRGATVRESEGRLARLALAPALLLSVLAIGLGVEPSLLLEAGARAAALLFGFGP